MGAAAIELAPGVHRLPLTAFDGVNAFALVADDGSVTLVDTGLRWSSQRVRAGLGAIGKDVRDVTRVVLTHAHPDHTGALPMFAESGAAITTHELEANYLRTGATPAPASRVGRLIIAIPGWGNPTVAVTSTVTDGELLEVAGGLRVIHTPGHTPGHVSLLHEPTGVLITGDSIYNLLARMSFSWMAFCADGPLSKQTADRLGEATYEVAAFTHGPEIRDNARERVRQFIASKRSS